MYRLSAGRLAYQLYAYRASKKNSMLSTFFRSAAHATDSTFIGCSANKAATIKLRQLNPVALWSSRKRMTAFAACSNTFP